MDRQHFKRPPSRASAERTSPATVPNCRTPSGRESAGRTWFPEDYICWDRRTPPKTILLNKSRSSQAALVPQEHRKFMAEAYNAAICYKMLRDMNSSDPLHLKYIIKKIKKMAQASPNLVMETIHDYFKDNPRISNRHKFRLFQVLEAVIGASDSLGETWEKHFTQLALENMTKSTELEETYQDAASNVLVAIFRHSWKTVAQQLEAQLLSGPFPHRSLIYAMSKLSSQEDEDQRKQWEEQLAQIALKSVGLLNSEMWFKEMLEALSRPGWSQQEQSPEKAFLFTYYGLILQAEEDSTKIRTHLWALLQSSHQWPRQREGMALTTGLAAARHLDDVWAILDQFGQSTPMKWSLHSFSSTKLEDPQWKWASSTLLLAYGQVAAKARTHILPWVDNILSRMVFYFRCSTWDDILKQSFLTATSMLLAAICRSQGAQSYEFSQTGELLECLTVLMEKEPQDTLCCHSRQEAITIITNLCELRPPMDTDRKSRLLSACLHSVFVLPQSDTLEKHTCHSREAHNIQVLYRQTTEALDHMLQSLFTQNPTPDELHLLLSHIYVWLASEKTHERQRAIQSCVCLLEFVNHNHYLDVSGNFERIGQLVGMLGILCQDPDGTTQYHSLEGVGHLYQLLTPQEEEPSQVEWPSAQEPSQTQADRATLWSNGDQGAATLVPQETAPQKEHVFQLGSSHAIKVLIGRLAMAELTDLVWTVIDGLGSVGPFRVQAAAQLLLSVIQEHGDKLETVAEMGQAIHQHLCTMGNAPAKEQALQAVTLLARNHTPELVAAFLDFSIPLDSHAFRLWRALGAEEPVSSLVLAVLLTWLRVRPLPSSPRGSPLPREMTYLRSLAAMNTLHELQFAREFKKAVREAYPELFLALLTQVHYVLELNLPTEALAKQPEGEAAPSPQRCSTSVEALKSLLSTTGHWHEFAHLELQDTWEYFTSIHTYDQGVGLLARAMVQNHCRQVKALLGHLLPRLQSREERERKAAIFIFIEFLYSPTLLEVLSRYQALTILAQGLEDPSLKVRVVSLQGLGNILFHPEKRSLLRRQIPPFLAGFFHKSESMVVGVMKTVSDVLRRLGAQGAGAPSLSVAINARSFFDDERDAIRAAAMALFGELVATVAGRELRGLRTQVCQSMLPLLLHLKDQCPAVVTQAKFAFYRCAVLLRWPLQHTLFCTLAWERGLSARHFLWTCLMTRSQEDFGIHLSQALSYLHSRHRHIKTWAALFIGYTTCYHPEAVSQMTNDIDGSCCFAVTFEDLRKDPEPGIREFASRLLSFFREVSARPQSDVQPPPHPRPQSSPDARRAWLYNIFPLERKV
ncbi:LOW QUALITY PROTEIN: maestro heat-like repeat family member 5 [Perognathus longimembris pacificus]|uniref:LOW QUALITY PROTEIN: maestro heat-like repeat family member 5 n=1 Tax=Perognathus longimembris pacificus TaxID=214514 RepID=UPI00201903B5|nr:LOW QUALITY PROTEIN: maestro heat-like repeat family member 5 [Perognathus longimembris pacificus]